MFDKLDQYMEVTILEEMHLKFLMLTNFKLVYPK